jgi:phosphoglycerate dehydrogenase-like enzyme
MFNMKAVFLNNGNDVGRVYPQEMQREMAGLMELYPEVVRQEAMEAHRAALRGAEVVFSTWGMPALTEGAISRYLPKLRILFYGAGTVQAFARPFFQRNIRVCSAWAANGEATADFAASVIRLSLKGFLPALRGALGDWHGMHALAERHPGSYDARVGLLGFGMIGRQVAQRLTGAGLCLTAYDPFVPAEAFAKLGVQRASTLEEVFRQSDAVSNHIANLPQTREMLRYEHFSAMGEYASFINTGRNAQVHVPGLVRAFSEAPLRTAYFDVTDPDEPPSQGNALLSLPNAYFTPHIAGATGREVRRMGAYMLDEFKRYAAGAPLLWEVTEHMLQTMA